MSVVDRAYDRAFEAGLCSTAAADYAYDVWTGHAPLPDRQPIYDYDDYGEPFLVGERGGVTDRYLEDEYGWRCRT